MLTGIEVDNNATSKEVIIQLVRTRELHTSVINGNGKFKLKLELSKKCLRK